MEEAQEEMMLPAVVVSPQERRTAVEVRADVQLIQQVMAAVMSDGVHYGKIPGTPKPSLWKAGAEKLCSAFRLAPKLDVDDLSIVDGMTGEPAVIRYRIKTKAVSASTGNLLGEGIGEASSGEERYKWRSAVVAEEWELTPEHMRRVKFAKAWDRDGKERIDKIQQVRTNPADIANTVLKMAAKRSLVDMVLKVTGASDVFAQDLEDLPSDLLDALSTEKRNEVTSRATVKEPQARGTASATTQTRAPTKGKAASSSAPPEPKDGYLVGEVHEITSKKGVIQKGKNAGREWEKFTIKLTNGAEISTFDKNATGACRAAAQRGAQVSIKVMKTQYGYEIERGDGMVEILEGQPTKKRAAPPPQDEEPPPMGDEDAPPDEDEDDGPPSSF